MANRYLKVLGQLVPTAATLSTLYTVPSATETAVANIFVSNNSAVGTTYRIAVRPAGATIDPKHYIYYDQAISGNTTDNVGGLSLDTTDVISVYATLGTLAFSAYGQENDK